MNESKRTIWFPAKTYGYGWGPPICWQGWVVVLIYIALLAGGARWLMPHKSAFVPYAIGLSLALTFICWLKGEKPAWRWGRPKK